MIVRYDSDKSIEKFYSFSGRATDGSQAFCGNSLYFNNLSTLALLLLGIDEEGMAATDRRVIYDRKNAKNRIM